jgi:PHD/YefM family antitoxin component YafN of YafNO toxin-antitoxin module
MTTSVSDASDRLPELIDRTRIEPVFLGDHGVVEAVLVSPGFFERAVEALEDIDDLAAFDAALEDDGPNLPWAATAGA